MGLLDDLKNKANNLVGGKANDYLQGINFPASKSEVISQLEAKGVPGPILDRVREVDTTQFDSVDDLKNKVGL